METSSKVTDLIRKRYSCRSYNGVGINPPLLEKLRSFLSSGLKGPFGSTPGFTVFAATEKDNDALKGLGTYGFIRGATAFISGFVNESEYNLEDYGYCMEKIILFAADLGIDTCWLGGSFKKSVFSEKTGVCGGEFIPAVAAAGFSAPRKRIFDIVARMSVRASKRKPFQNLFFLEDFATPLPEETAGPLAGPLEMVRLAPSATNRQPWRIVMDRDGNRLHFYLQRTKNYYERNKKYFGLTDMQRIDMGIAMCHFEVAAAEDNIDGDWEINDPGIGRLPEETGYIVTRTISRCTV